MAGSKSRLSHFLLHFTEAVQRHALQVIGIYLVLAIMAAYYAATHLGVNTATNDMFSRDLEWFQRFNAFRDEFPVLERNVIVVLEGEIPEQVEQAQLDLANSLRQSPSLFGKVLAPETTDFFLENGLLFLSLDELQDLGDRLAAMQPLIGRLFQQPNLSGFVSLLTDSLENATNRNEEFDRTLTAVTAVFEEGRDGIPASISWQRLFAEETQVDIPVLERRVIVIVPELDFVGAEPRRRVLNGLREEAEALGFAGSVSESGITVRLTGGLALEQEELASVADGIIQGAIATFILVIVILSITFRSTRLLLASLITLVSGLAITAAFTAMAIGYINLISVAFVVMYIGLGIDFAIHYCLRYRELIAAGEAHLQALAEASEDTGAALVLCALTSSVGFLAFVPTSFSGVAELGLIAGFGMFASLVSTLVLLPALITRFGPPRNALVQHTPPLFGTIGHYVHHHLWAVRLVLLAIAAGSIWLATRAEFDSNPVNLRDPQSESVMAYRDLLADPDAPPLTLNALVERAQLEATSELLEALPQVESVRSIADFLPAEQSEKIAVLEDFILFTGLPQAIELEDVVIERDLQALEEAIPLLLNSPRANEIAMGRVMQQWLETVDEANADQRLQHLQTAILQNLALTWNRLVAGFQPAAFEEADLPADIRQLWTLADGRQRLEILSSEPLLEMVDIGEFVEAVTAEVPQATGQPTIQYNAGQTVVGAFMQAIISAVIVVLVLLLILLRNLRHALAVIVPLLLATVATAAVVTISGQSFNFANVITLPLLIGVGVDNGIHMVKRYHHGKDKGVGKSALMASSTARAILFSTITTIGSFGTLALSNHPGTASMGVVLAIGMTMSLLAALFVVPSMLPDEG